MASQKIDCNVKSVCLPSDVFLCGQGTMSQKIYELIIQISWKYMLPFFEKLLSDQVTILHMPWQLSCHGMCKFVTWLDHWNKK